MGKWFKDFEALIWFGSIAAAVTLYAITTFATQASLDEKEKTIKEMWIRNTSLLRGRLQNIEHILERIDERVYEMKKNKSYERQKRR